MSISKLTKAIAVFTIFILLFTGIGYTPQSNASGNSAGKINVNSLVGLRVAKKAAKKAVKRVVKKAIRKGKKAVTTQKIKKAIKKAVKAGATVGGAAVIGKKLKDKKEGQSPTEGGTDEITPKPVEEQPCVDVDPMVAGCQTEGTPYSGTGATTPGPDSGTGAVTNSGY